MQNSGLQATLYHCALRRQPLVIVFFPILFLLYIGPLFAKESGASSDILSHSLDSYRPDICQPNDGLIICANKIEENALNKSHTHVVRKENKLFVSPVESRRIFSTTPNVIYRYAGTTHDYAIVVEIFEEGWDVLAIHMKSGSETRLPGFPLFNAHGTLMAAHSLDLDAGFRKNVVKIYEIFPGKPQLKKEISKFPEMGGPVSIQWITDHTLKINIGVMDSSSGNLKIVSPLFFTPQ